MNASAIFEFLDANAFNPNSRFGTSIAVFAGVRLAVYLNFTFGLCLFGVYGCSQNSSSADSLPITSPSTSETFAPGGSYLMQSTLNCVETVQSAATINRAVVGNDRLQILLSHTGGCDLELNYHFQIIDARYIELRPTAIHVSGACGGFEVSGPANNISQRLRYNWSQNGFALIYSDGLNCLTFKRNEQGV